MGRNRAADANITTQPGLIARTAEGTASGTIHTSLIAKGMSWNNLNYSSHVQQENRRRERSPSQGQAGEVMACDGIRPRKGAAGEGPAHGHVCSQGVRLPPDEERGLFKQWDR